MSLRTSSRDAGPNGWLMGAVKNNPEGLLLLAAGCALLMRSAGTDRTTRGDIYNPYGDEIDYGYETSRAGDGRAGGAMRRTAQSVRESGAGIVERVKETGSSLASSASSYAEDTRRVVSERSGQMADQVQSTVQETVSRVIEEQPLALPLVGLAAGAALAAALPPTKMEKRTIGPAGEQLTEAAEKAGSRLKRATGKAQERLEQTAEERGLNAAGLKEVASDVAETFGDSLSGKDRARSGRQADMGSNFQQPASSPARARKSDKTAGPMSPTRNRTDGE